MIKSEVFCTLDVEGIHCWPDCPIPEVEYLQHPHRHVFKIKACVNVMHDDRFVEFIELKHRIVSYIENKYWSAYYKCCDFKHMSCEMIARELIHQFDLSSCEVSEDGENGSILTVIEED